MKFTAATVLIAALLAVGNAAAEKPATKLNAAKSVADKHSRKLIDLKARKKVRKLSDSPNLEWIGDGECDYSLNTAEHNYDGGDCCPSTCQVADYDCTSAIKKTCKDPSAPEYVPIPEELSPSHPWIGDGECDYELNTEEYNYDGGDCCPSTCQPGEYDCTSASKRGCQDPSTPEYASSSEELHPSHPWVGDGECDHDLNTAEYRFDGGDCCPSTCQPGDYDCSKTTILDCYDLAAPDIQSHPYIGDGSCDHNFNTAEFSYDEGDCCPSTCLPGTYDCTYASKRDCLDPNASEYIPSPDVLSESHPWIGDGECDYDLNTAEYRFDGGDCCPSTCQTGAYDCSKTTVYDCVDPNTSDMLSLVGNGECDYRFNTMEFEYDGGDCCPSTCQVDDFDCSTAHIEGCFDPNTQDAHSHPWIGDTFCDENLNTPDFGYDGGDCCISTCLGENCATTNELCKDPSASVSASKAFNTNPDLNP